MGSPLGLGDRHVDGFLSTVMASTPDGWVTGIVLMPLLFGLGSACTSGDPSFGPTDDAQQQVRKLDNLRSLNWIRETDRSVTGWIFEGADGAGADPTPPPSPGYRILTPDGPRFPGNQIYPPRCLEAMLSCGFRYDPGTGTWAR
jgi:hypothetical protein